MKTTLQTMAAGLLILGSAVAQSSPATSTGLELSALAAASDARLLDQRAAGTTLGQPIENADRLELSAEQSRHEDFANLRADDISNHDIVLVLATVGIVVLIALLV